jgi:hypothetical protein
MAMGTETTAISGNATLPTPAILAFDTPTALAS